MSDDRPILITGGAGFIGSNLADRLAGEAIPLAARIFSVVDVYDALTSVRPYKPAWTAAQALAEIAAQAGRQFDPDVVRVFVGTLGGALAEAAGDEAAPDSAPARDS